MFRSCSFKNREVININTAEKIGMVSDVEIDTANGNIRAIVVKRGSRPVIFGGEFMIPWEHICVIGEDVILVNMMDFIESKN